MKLFSCSARKGFTLLEVVVAIGILVIALGGAVSLIVLTRESEAVAKNNLTAAYLAREGMELVRNVRDDNYDNSASFHQDIATIDDPYTYAFVIDAGGRTSISGVGSGKVNDAPVLNFVDQRYQYSSSPGFVATPFRRLITTTYHAASGGQSAYVDVKVEVSWSGDTKSRVYTLTSALYDWK